MLKNAATHHEPFETNDNSAVETSAQLAQQLFSFVAAPSGVVLAVNQQFNDSLFLGQKLQGVALSSLFENPPVQETGHFMFNRVSQHGANPLPLWPEGVFPLTPKGFEESILFHVQHVRGADGRLYISAYGPAEKFGLVAPKAAETPLPVSVSKIKLQGALPWSKLQNTLLADDAQVFDALTQDVHMVLDQTGEVLRANANATAMFWRGGAGAAANTLRSLADTVVQQDRMAFRSAFQALQDAGVGQVQTLDLQHNRFDGHKIWVHWRFMRLASNQIAALGYDVTTSKTTILKLRSREQQLREAETIARMGQWRWAVGTNLFEWSDEVYKIFNVERSRFVPTVDNVQPLVHRRDLGIIFQAFQRSIIQQNDYEVDFRVQLANGQIRHVRCEGRCELDAEGDVCALYGIMQDITAQVEHERDLRVAKESVENAYAAKSRFLANMSHELRTPLNAIIGFSDLMQKQMLGPLGHERYIDYVTAIKESGQHLLDLISDILDMSKIEEGKYTLHLETVEVSKLVQLATHMVEGRAQEAGVALVNAAHDAENTKIVADRRAVMQILLNLVSNAVKFTERGGKVSVQCKRLDSALLLSVEDNGIGIPANKLADVLRPFEQVSNAHSRRHEGSGLGLAITKELVELHGGSLSIESKLGEGTTVTVRLPLEAKEKPYPTA